VVNEKHFEDLSIFSLVCPYWASKGASPFSWTNLNPHPPSMILTKFGWNWPIGSGEEAD